MTPEQFVRALEEVCRDSAVEDCVGNFLKPPGRQPSDSLVRLSRWFTALPASDQQMVAEAMRESADATLFGVLCVIDGVRVIEQEGEKSEFELTATRAGFASKLSPSDTYLHDLLRGETLYLSSDRAEK